MSWVVLHLTIVEIGIFIFNSNSMSLAILIRVKSSIIPPFIRRFFWIIARTFDLIDRSATESWEGFFSILMFVYRQVF